MGLPSYTGPATFAADWQRAVESNGCVVEAISAIEANADPATEFPSIVRLGDSVLNCLGTTSKMVEPQWQSPEDLYTLILVVRSRSAEDEGLRQDVHQILAASGATSRAFGGGYVLFKSNFSKEEIQEKYSDALSRQGFELRIAAAKHPEAVTRGTVYDGAQRALQIAEVSVGRSIDLVTREPCSFLAIRPASVLSRAASLLTGKSYSAVLDLCQELPLARV